MSTVSVKDKYREETNEDVYASMENYGAYTDNYVKWLENQVMNNFVLDNVSDILQNCTNCCRGVFINKKCNNCGADKIM
jgi:hypothetical protein